MSVPKKKTVSIPLNRAGAVFRRYGINGGEFALAP